MIWVVLDANIYISGLVFGGRPRELIDLALDAKLEVLLSEPIQREVERILSTKFGWEKKRVEAECAVIWSAAHRVKPRQHLQVITDDPADDRILECAVEAHAGWIASGDRHLLKLGSYEGISIVKPVPFLDSKPWEELS